MDCCFEFSSDFFCYPGTTQLNSITSLYPNEILLNTAKLLFLIPPFTKIRDVMVALRRKFDSHGMNVSVDDKEDLDMPNHLSGKVNIFICYLHLLVRTLHTYIYMSQFLISLLVLQTAETVFKAEL